MKQMKILGVLAMTLMLGLSACGGSSGNKNSGGDNSGASGASSKSSRHTHTAAADAQWQSDDNNHWKDCIANDGGKVDNARHTWVADPAFADADAATKATCTEDGQEHVKCSVCGKTKVNTLTKLGHYFGDDTEDPSPAAVAKPGQEPQIGEPGVGIRHCKRCDQDVEVEMPALTANLTVDKASLRRDATDPANAKVYLVFEGTFDSYTTTAQFKWALGFKDNDADFLDTGAPETPAAADYKYEAVEFDTTKGEYKVEMELGPIFSGKKAATYNVYAGPKGNYKSYSSISLQPGNYSDPNFNYYFRNDQETSNVFSVCADELPPYFHFTEAEPYFNDKGDEDATNDEYWAKIYGKALDQTKTVEALQAELNALTPAFRFQAQSNSMTTREEKDTQYKFEVKKVGDDLMVYLHVNIQYMVDASNTVYNTHLNLKYGQEGYTGKRYTNCVMENKFDNRLAVGDTGRYISVFSDPWGANDVQNSYGNLGFRLADAAALPAGEYHGLAKTAGGSFLPVDLELVAAKAAVPAQGEEGQEGYVPAQEAVPAAAKLYINGEAVEANLSWDGANNELSLATSGAFGTIAASYENGSFSIKSISGAAASALDLTYAVTLSNKCQFIDCEGSNEQLHQIFTRRKMGSSWDESAENNTDEKLYSTNDGRVGKGVALRCWDSGKVAIRLANDLTGVNGKNAKAIGCWAYNPTSAQTKVRVFLYKAANMQSNVQAKEVTLPAGQWTFIQTGLIIESSTNPGTYLFGENDSLYNFQIYTENVASHGPLVFDNFCIYM